MQKVGGLVKDKVERILVENEMLRAGFAAFPYLVLRDTKLSATARFTYAVLLTFAWQEGSTFASQEKMAEIVGVSIRQLQRYLGELKASGYIGIERADRRYNNTYIIKDVTSKLRKKP